MKTTRPKLRTRLLMLLLTCSISSLTFADAIWIDVRSVIEHKVDNIEGDIRISHNEVVEKIGALYPDKNLPINLYCRSGGRAGKALSALQAEGYKNVRNVGSIRNARTERNMQ